MAFGPLVTGCWCPEQLTQNCALHFSREGVMLVLGVVLLLAAIIVRVDRVVDPLDYAT